MDPISDLFIRIKNAGKAGHESVYIPYSKYKHEIVTHSIGEYSVGDRHTNTIEGAWSLLKRGIMGIYHHVSQKHLPLYLNEFAYRYNTLELNEGQRVNALLEQCGGRITYKEVIA